MKLMKWFVIFVYASIIFLSYIFPAGAARIILPRPPRFFLGVTLPTIGVGSVYYSAPGVWYAPKSPYWRPNHGMVAPNGANLSGRAAWMNAQNAAQQAYWRKLLAQWGKTAPKRGN